MPSLGTRWPEEALRARGGREVAGERCHRAALRQGIATGPEVRHVSTSTAYRSILCAAPRDRCRRGNHEEHHGTTEASYHGHPFKRMGNYRGWFPRNAGRVPKWKRRIHPSAVYQNSLRAKWLRDIADGTAHRAKPYPKENLTLAHCYKIQPPLAPVLNRRQHPSNSLALRANLGQISSRARDFRCPFAKDIGISWGGRNYHCNFGDLG